MREFKKKIREAAVVRFRQKRKERNFANVVRYDCRKRVADARFFRAPLPPMAECSMDVDAEGAGTTPTAPAAEGDARIEEWVTGEVEERTGRRLSVRPVQRVAVLRRSETAAVSSARSQSESELLEMQEVIKEVEASNATSDKRTES